jgi:Organic Anion Transporter Polypeptide (OATP) family
MYLLFFFQIFENCSCAQGSEPAVDGLCPIDCAQAFAIFVIIHCIQRFFGATGRAGNTLIHFRCVSPEDKPVSVGLLEFCLCAFAFIPAPLIYGHLIGIFCINGKVF